MTQCELNRCIYLASTSKGKMMIKTSLWIAITSILFAGCATVPMASKEASAQAKQFAAPQAGQAGVYIYRDSSFGAALKKDVKINGKCVGETAPNMFFYQTVAADQEHTLSTESEFSPNNLLVKTESGKNYFVRQYIKLGLFVGGADLELMDELQGKKDISGLELATPGNCSQ